MSHNWKKNAVLVGNQENLPELWPTTTATNNSPSSFLYQPPFLPPTLSTQSDHRRTDEQDLRMTDIVPDGLPPKPPRYRDILKNELQLQRGPSTATRLFAVCYNHSDCMALHKLITTRALRPSEATVWPMEVPAVVRWGQSSWSVLLK